MISNPFNTLKAGIEITADHVKMALIRKRGHAFSIKKLSDTGLIPHIIKPSFKIENIIDENAFKQSLKKSCKDIPLTKVGLALPDACIKVLIKRFAELPDELFEIDEMVSWDISRSLNLPAEDLRISWENMGIHSDGTHVLLVAMGMKTVISQYESVLRKIGVAPQLISPAGLNQYNFYSYRLPEKGNVAYLGIFDDFVNIFVFFDGVPVFYKIIKKGLLGGHGSSAINDVDLLIQYYNTENPDFAIEHFYIASYIKSESHMEQVLHDIGDIDFEIIEERQLIGFDKKFALRTDNKPLPFYTGVLGAAQGA